VKNENVELAGSEIKISGPTLSEELERACDNEPFRTQPAIGFCSGFLVADDILATAGHCIEGVDILDVAIFFDYSLIERAPKEVYRTTFSESEYYKVSGVIAAKNDGRSKEDWALLRLNKNVVGRAPVQLRTTGKVEDDSDLCVVGHPLGLPKKIACNAGLTSNDNPIYFEATLDTYAGNSGSMVFNQATKEVEGILVRGQQDFRYDTQQECVRSTVCPKDTNSCGGEGVTRIGAMSAALLEAQQ